MNARTSMSTAVGDTVLFAPGYINYPKFTGIVRCAEDKGYYEMTFIIRAQRQWLLRDERLCYHPLPFRMVLTEKKIFSHLPPARITHKRDGHKSHVDLEYIEDKR